MSLLTNIVAYYKFDEGRGSSVGDSVGTNTGTWGGTLGSQWTTGKINTGGSFNGTDNVVTLTSAPLSGSGSFSIFAWIKTSNTGVRKDIFTNGTNAVDNDAVTLFINTSNQVETDVTNFAGPNSTATVTDGLPHHVGVINTAGSFQIYIDGASSGTPVSLSPNLGTTSALIGKEIGGSFFMNGVVDDLGIWSRALVSGDRTSLYNGGNGLQYPFGLGVPVANFAGTGAPQPSTNAVIIN